MADDYNGIPAPENQNPEPGNSDQSDNIPDWMKEAGWETSSGTFDESKPVFDDLDDEDDIVPADIPAWLEEAAPEGFTSDPNATPAFEGLDVDEPFITTGDLVPPPSMQPPEEKSEPDDTELDAFDIPTWLENLKLDEDSQETAVAWLENMPEDLRATEEELQAAKETSAEEPDVIEEPVDELAWVDDIAAEPEQPRESVEGDQAALSEDLVASELIPEAGEPEQIFEQAEIESMESELPSWLKELGDDQPEIPAAEVDRQAPPAEETETAPEDRDESIPDWLRTVEETEIPESPEMESAAPPSEETADFPDWLTDFEEVSPDGADEAEGLEWLDSLAPEDTALGETELPATEDLSTAVSADESDFSSLDLDETLPGEPASFTEDILQPEGVSPNDETLNAQVPEWLSNLDEAEDLEEESPTAEAFKKLDFDEPSLTEDEFEAPDSWLDQISEQPPDSTRDDIASQESEVIDWLDDMDSLREDLPDEPLDEIEEPSIDVSPEGIPSVELETAKYFEDEPAEDEKQDDLPDWLSELRETDEETTSLEEAIRQSDHELNDAEVDFLSRVEEKQEEDSDWLSKLDGVESQPDLEPSTPAIELEPLEEQEIIEEPTHEPIMSGGILDRLIETGELKPGDAVPQWLEDIKKEEDPQETAVLWLQQFVNQGDEVNIKDEIKRYTDELDPGDSIPKWMEDLKNEEDPQTTAMLWLEKLSSARQAQAAPEPSIAEEEDSGWLADLEREAAESETLQASEDIKDFDDEDEGWLADLEIDQKLKSSEEEMPEWSKTEDKSPEGEPPWMKATSPLEGDFYTDELAGGEEKEVEIPEWLAGYAEGERPEGDQDQESPVEEEYTWLSATDTPAPSRTPLDLNKAAISQLEGILGISHQIAKGIVTYREKHGPFQGFSDLKNVPEITDEQTIDILKPEVFISETPPADAPPTEEPPIELPPAELPPADLPPAEAIPAEERPAPVAATETKPAPPPQKPVKKPSKGDNFEELLVMARSRIDESLIAEATDLFAKLIKKKKFLDEVIEDLQKASLDHPLEISIPKTLGDAYMQKDMLDEALEAYSKAEDLLS